MWFARTRRLMYAVVGSATLSANHPDEEAMVALSISEGRRRLHELRKKVVSDHDQVILTHKSGNVVLVSMDEWNVIQETQRLLKDRETLEALVQSFKDHDAKKRDRGKSVTEVFSDLA